MERARAAMLGQEPQPEGGPGKVGQGGSMFPHLALSLTFATAAWHPASYKRGNSGSCMRKQDALLHIVSELLSCSIGTGRQAHIRHVRRQSRLYSLMFCTLFISVGVLEPAPGV